MTWGLGLALTAVIWAAASFGFVLGWALRARLGTWDAESVLDRRGMYLREPVA